MRPMTEGVNAAPLKNMTRLAELVEKGLGAPEHMPRMVCFSGWSGLGKSFAAAHVAARYQATYCQATSLWTRKSLLEDILVRLGKRGIGRHSANQLLTQLADTLATSRRPLILDEVDHIVGRGLIELVRDIYERSNAPIVLIGEEALPEKLQQYERFHGRIGAWAQAQPCDLEDARALAALYCPKLALDDGLLGGMVQATGGSARRLRVNLERVREFAAGEGLRAVSAKDWGQRDWWRGEAPKARIGAL